MSMYLHTKYVSVYMADVQEEEVHLVEENEHEL